jgi:hypothetical protein
MMVSVSANIAAAIITVNVSVVSFSVIPATAWQDKKK